MFKKILIIIISLLLVIGASIFIITKNKDEKVNISKICVINLNNAKTEADKIELVKNNIVKITNKLNDNEIVGTGFFNEDGYLITNSHIVDRNGKITITYNDNTSTEGKLISNDINSDIALLVVENPKVLALKMADTLNLRVTDELYTIGYSYNLIGEATTNKGIFSARRSAGGIEYLQTDAAVDKGSSGGPLLNNKGELVGMNTYATSNSSIGMAISSESLQNVIKKLLENQNINYIENQRPENALSVVLLEIGYEVQDLYDEKEFIKEEKIENKNDNKDKENKNDEKYESHEDTLNNNSSLLKLDIENYDISFESRKTNYELVLKNGETKLKINPVLVANTAKYIITGNENFQDGHNEIKILVTSKNNTSTEYIIDVFKPYTYYEGIDGVLCALDVKRYNGINNFHIHGCDFVDSDRVRFVENVPLDVAKSITVFVYAGWNEGKTTGVATNGKEMRLLKTYKFSPNYEYYIGINEIRELLDDDDYEGGSYNGADLTFVTEIETRKQGSFKAINPWGIEKN